MPWTAVIAARIVPHKRALDSVTLRPRLSAAALGLVLALAACDGQEPEAEATDLAVTASGTCGLAAQEPYLYVASAREHLACVAADGTVDTLTFDEGRTRGGDFQLHYLPGQTVLEVFAGWLDRFDTRVGVLRGSAFEVLAPDDGAPPPSKVFPADGDRLLTTALDPHDGGVRLTARVHGPDLGVTESVTVDVEALDLDVRYGDLYGDRAVISATPYVPSSSGGLRTVSYAVLFLVDFATGEVTVLDGDAPLTDALVLLDGAAYYASVVDQHKIVLRQPLGGGPAERVVDLGPSLETFSRADVAQVGRDEVAALVEDGGETTVVVFDAAGSVVRSGPTGGRYSGVEASADGRTLCVRRFEKGWFGGPPPGAALPETDQFATMDAATLRVTRRDTVDLGPATNDGYHFACAVGL